MTNYVSVNNKKEREINFKEISIEKKSSAASAESIQLFSPLFYGRVVPSDQA